MASPISKRGETAHVGDRGAVYESEIVGRGDHGVAIGSGTDKLIIGPGAQRASFDNQKNRVKETKTGLAFFS